MITGVGVPVGNGVPVGASVGGRGGVVEGDGTRVANAGHGVKVCVGVRVGSE